MDDYLTYQKLEYWANEYRRLRYALPRGTRFIDFLNLRDRYVQYAKKRLRDWSANQRLALGRVPIFLN